MFCEIVNSVPPADIIWYKNGEQLPTQDPNYFTQSANQVLTFTSIQTSDVGRYECRANNKAGETNKIFNVEVQGTVDSFSSNNFFLSFGQIQLNSTKKKMYSSFI